MGSKEHASRLRRAVALVAGLAVMGLVLGGVAVASIPTSTTGQVGACYRVSNGALRVIDVQQRQRCVAGERLLVWGPTWVWRGAYSSRVAYPAGSVVLSNASSYVARVAVPKGRAPSGNGSAYWGLVASVGTHSHDERYYTEAESDARYPTKAELQAELAAVKAGAAQQQADLQAEIAALKAANATQDAYLETVLMGTAPVPSGKTVTGYGGFDHTIVANNEDVYVAVQLPGRATTDLAPEMINFAPVAGLVDDGDATCTGTVSDPTAPPGKVCLYLGRRTHVDGLSGTSAVQPGFNDRFFLVYGLANGAQGDDLFFRFSWAYRAP